MSTIRKPDHLAFFLGGHDLEMETIASLVRGGGRPLYDKDLAWNAAKTSAYQSEIATVPAAEMTPVLVELNDDNGLPQDRIRLVNHQGDRAGADAPTSLGQIFALLELPASNSTRWYELVAANDRGHIDEMAALDASIEEMREICAADRQVQGVGPDYKAANAIAVTSVETHASEQTGIRHLSV